ncbi:oligosaccharide flippase family protein [Cryobacterium sp. Y29]|uniref:oligosaccharide flippase family protein n=1 Tax=Cryobacterium sp. Y29 TaxID=2048285 RepID=UPI000CE3862A|nr:oligosaccharide flippase family protein [Cryobacterium sp. Y29]
MTTIDPGAAGSAGPVAPHADPAPAASSHLFGRGLLYVMVWSLQLVAGTIVSPILAHVMGPAEFGALASAIALHQVLSVLALIGLDQALVLQRGEDGHTDRARGIMAVGIVIALVVALIAGGTAPLWRDALGFGDYPALVFAVVLWTLPAATVQIVLALLLAEDRLGSFALVSVLAAVGGLVVGVVLLLTVRNDAATYAIGGVVSQTVAMIIGLIVTRPVLRGLLDWPVAWRAIKLGVPLALGGLAIFVLNAGDRIVIQRILGPEEVGRYQIAYVVGSVVILLLTFTSSAWTPRFAALRDESQRWLLAVQSRNELYRLLMPMVAGVTLAAPLLLRIVAPPSFRPESLTLIVFLVAISAFPVAAGGATGRLLITLRRGKTIGLIASVAAAGNIGLNILLVPIYGLLGSALATLLAFCALAALQRLALPDRPAFARPPTRLMCAVAVTLLIAGGSVLLPQTLGWNVARLVVAVLCLPWFVGALRRARAIPPDGTSEPNLTSRSHDVRSNSKEPFLPHSVHTSRIPASPADLVELPDNAPGPCRIVAIDLDQPCPELVIEPHYDNALIVGWRAGCPVGTVYVELGSACTPVIDQVQALIGATVNPAGEVVVADIDLPSISVVVSTVVGRVSDLRRLLDSLELVDYPAVEFIIVDNRRTVGPDDPLPELLQGRAGMRSVRAVQPGISAGRNAGIAAATGDVVAYTDDDVQVDSQWLRALGRRFALQPEVDAVTGLILPAELETPAQVWFERYSGGFGGERTFTALTLSADSGPVRAIRGSRISVRNAAGTTTRRLALYGVGAYGAGANMAFRRNVLERLGGFDTALGTGTPARGGEDLAMLINVLWAGGQLAYEPTSVVHHRHRRDYAGLVNQIRGNGIGFTAMLVSLIQHDRRHLLSVAWQLPLAVVRILQQGSIRIRGGRVAGGGLSALAPVQARTSGYPRSLILTELGNYWRGPAAYRRSQRADQSWLAAQATPLVESRV